MTTLPYSLPKARVPEVLGNISPYWNTLDGMLVAPRGLYKEECVAKNTRLALQGPFRNLTIHFQGVHDQPYGAKARKLSFAPRNVLPDIVGIFTGKQPSSISFDDVTLYKDGHAIVVHILDYAVRGGYLGKFKFTHTLCLFSRHEETARVEFDLAREQLSFSADGLRGEALTFKRTLDRLLK